MEPASILTLVGSVASLVVLTGRLARDIHTLLEKTSDVSKTMKLIEAECKMLQSSFRRIGQWIESQGEFSKDLQDEAADLDYALGVCKDSLDKLEADITNVASASPSTSKLSWKVTNKAKVRYLWNEDVMKDHLDGVRWQGVALHLLLSSSQLGTNVAKRQIRQVSRAASIRHSRLSDTVSGVSGTSFGFDKDVLQSAAYRRANVSAVRKTLDWGEREVTAPSNSHSWSVGSIVVATRDYYVKDSTHLELREGDFVEVLARSSGNLCHGKLNGKQGLFPVTYCDMSTPLTGLSGEKTLQLETMFFKDIEDNLQRQANEKKIDLSRRELELGSITDISGGKPGGEVRDAIEFGLPASSVREFDDASAEAQVISAIKQKLLEKPGLNIEARDQEGKTALHHALFLNDMLLLRALVEHGANVNAQFNDRPPIMIAASLSPNIAVQAVSLLQKHGASTRFRTPNGTPFLHSEIRLGHEKVVKVLIEHGIYTESKGLMRKTPLHMASELGQVSTIRALCKQGADLMAKTTNGDSPLHAAARAGSVPACLELLYAMSHGGARAISMPKDNDGNTPLHCAASVGNAAIINVLAAIQTSSLPYKVLMKVRQPNGNPSASQVRAWPFWNSKNHSGSTALHCAADLGSEAAVSALLDRGASITTRDPAGRTCLHRAVRQGHEAVCELLIHRGGSGLVKDSSHPVNTIDLIAMTILTTALFAPVYVICFPVSDASIPFDMVILVTGSVLLAALKYWWYYPNPPEYDLFPSSEQTVVSVVFQDVAIVLLFFSMPLSCLAALAFEPWTQPSCPAAAFLLITTATTLLLSLMGALYGAFTKGQIYDRLTPLHVAILSRREDIIRLLIAEGAPLHAKGRVRNLWFTPLNLARDDPNTWHLEQVLRDAGAKS